MSYLVNTLGSSSTQSGREDELLEDASDQLVAVVKGTAAMDPQAWVIRV
jgi:hypothetical protein